MHQKLSCFNCMTFEGQMSTIDGEGDWEEKWEVSPINY